MSDTQLFTCLSCSIAFLTPEDQRAHYRSDHHRYNMKRRVASLPPISAEVFNQKVIERKQETAIMSSTRGSSCEVCNKVYTTENAYRSHIQSKKHKENEIKAAHQPSKPVASEEAPVTQAVPEPENPVPKAVVEATPVAASSSTVKEDDDEEEEEAIEAKIAAARSRLAPTHCLFCSNQSSSLEENLTHMSTAHSFFIPDAEYLIDIPGLITYLGEKIAVGNVCIFCNEKGREFRTMDAVRKHMLDKSHCKIGYDSQKDRLEVSDYYDFTSSYPDGAPSFKPSRVSADEESDQEWEDADDVDNDEVDEVVEDSGSEESTESDSEEDLPDNELTYGDTDYELVLPSGARIGHRSMRRYYAQAFPGAPRGSKPEDPNSGAALVRRLLADKNSALVPRRGGFGAYGAGTDVVKARNRGEAREAGRHVREFRDQRRREDFKTKVGFIHNSQKHFRDPLLQ
ncbi:C2H2 type zinc-finger-domain-containing protein [Crepidotus variabilis]|uniref:C2H2 type zinc-finger-domain-containing protein n=1 Tax=Crepidotus variabilis TaxID=179855 RepID=A0A9P6EIJ4_9AGAR|nr:C2H2 type zinc-finger-domain-containing protein [Crepidotus variabilis]